MNYDMLAIRSQQARDKEQIMHRKRNTGPGRKANELRHRNCACPTAATLYDSGKPYFSLALFTDRRRRRRRSVLAGTSSGGRRLSMESAGEKRDGWSMLRRRSTAFSSASSATTAAPDPITEAAGLEGSESDDSEVREQAAVVHLCCHTFTCRSG